MSRAPGPPRPARWAPRRSCPRRSSGGFGGRAPGFAAAAGRARRIAAVGLALAAATIGLAPRGARAADAPPTVPPATNAATVERDVVYGRAGGDDLRLDVTRPAGDGPFPAVLLLHGGGWQQGSRTELDGIARALADRGWVAASASYRLAPRFRFPAAVEDASCAVRYLRAEAARWRIDPARIAAWGEGEGGHLALLVALLGRGDGFDGMGGHAETSRAVAAAVAFGAPSQLSAWSAWRGAEPHLRQRYGKGSAGLLLDFLGSEDRGAPVFAAASPLTWVGAGDPPVLSVHGEQDPVVP
ncbi:MAG: alpha/beta hydrolase, partial [Planctomycetia bacterium]|nr:alpha/beta hydrolase [Planctomycetia bacterium]